MNNHVWITLDLIIALKHEYIITLLGLYGAMELLSIRFSSETESKWKPLSHRTAVMFLMERADISQIFNMFKQSVYENTNFEKRII